MSKHLNNIGTVLGIPASLIAIIGFATGIFTVNDINFIKTKNKEVSLSADSVSSLSSQPDKENSKKEHSQQIVKEVNDIKILSPQNGNTEVTHNLPKHLLQDNNAVSYSRKKKEKSSKPIYQNIPAITDKQYNDYLSTQRPINGVSKQTIETPITDKQYNDYLSTQRPPKGLGSILPKNNDEYQNPSTLNRTIQINTYSSGGNSTIINSGNTSTTIIVNGQRIN